MVKTNKKAKIILLIALILTLMISGTLEMLSFYRSFNSCNAIVGEEVVNSFDAGSKKYLFLPSFARVLDYKLSSDAQQSNVNVMCSSNINSIFIDTESGTVDKITSDKNYKEVADIRIYNPKGTKITSSGLKYIKGHGNYTFYTDKFKKKSFSIEYPDGKKYTLFANASDPTFLRNEIARNLEIALGVRYAKTGEFVDLYLNGDYYGNYYLARNLEISNDSIDITSIDYESKGNAVNPEDITGGYIIEREFYGRFIGGYAGSINGMVTDKGECFIIHYPKNCTEEENEYILSVINQVENAMDISFAEIDKLIDINSFVLRYLSDEVTKNYDMGISSAYFYKDSALVDEKLYYGPGWDYDMSMGSYADYMHYKDEDATGLTLGLANEDSSLWFRKLYHFDEVQIMIKSIYEEKVVPYVDGLVSRGIDEYYYLLNDSATMDSIRWESMYCIDGKYPNDYGEYEYLRHFVQERKTYLDSVWCE